MCDAREDDDFGDLGYEESFQDDMQTAIALSIADVQNMQRQVQGWSGFKVSIPLRIFR